MAAPLYRPQSGPEILRGLRFPGAYTAVLVGTAAAAYRWGGPHADPAEIIGPVAILTFAAVLVGGWAISDTIQAWAPLATARIFGRVRRGQDVPETLVLNALECAPRWVLEREIDALLQYRPILFLSFLAEEPHRAEAVTRTQLTRSLVSSDPRVRHLALLVLPGTRPDAPAEA